MEKEIKKAVNKRKSNKFVNPTKVKEVPIEAQERLVEIANDGNRAIRLMGKEYHITALRPAVQWLIAEEAVKILKVENANMGDVLKQFAHNQPAVIKCIALAISNDKDKIFSDYRNKIYSKEFLKLLEDIEWESDSKEWMGILANVLALIDIEVFFYTTEVIGIVRRTMTQKKMTMEEAKLSQQGQSGE